MKPALTISLIVFSCLGIGFYQQFRLADLNAETTTLWQSSSQPSGQDQALSGDFIAASTQTGDVPPVKSLAEIETIMVRSFGLIAKLRNGELMDPAEQSEAGEAGKLLLSTFGSLDHQSVFDLIEKMKSNANLPAELRENSAAACLEILMQANPKQAIAFLQMSGDSPNRENQINQAFNQWANANPAEALHWFEEESKKENPVVDTIRKSALLVQARVDPSRAMSHERFEKLLSNPEGSENLGASIASSLRDARDNSAFLVALRREQEKQPGSANLSKIRSEFIAELSARMHRWAFEDASQLIDSEFTAAEKIAAVERISRWSDLAEPASWATWFAESEVPENGRHPLRTFIAGWARSDHVSAGKWLHQLPPGDLKTTLIVEYSFQVADFDPVTATKEAMDLPPGERRNKILRQIAKKWNEKDPSAAAAFAKQHDLPK